jgi:hypothetical protein
MRKLLILVAVLAAIAVIPATASAGDGGGGGGDKVHGAICGTCGGGLGGWTGCTSQRADHTASIWPIASVDHYLIVNYCKQNGWITSISIAVHGCDAHGLVSCSTGPAWMTSGGVGWGFASFEAHANWVLYTTPFVNNADTLTLDIPIG